MELMRLKRRRGRIILTQILQFRNDILKIFDATYLGGPKDSYLE